MKEEPSNRLGKRLHTRLTSVLSNPSRFPPFPAVLYLSHIFYPRFSTVINRCDTLPLIRLPLFLPAMPHNQLL